MLRIKHGVNPMKQLQREGVPEESHECMIPKVAMQCVIVLVSGKYDMASIS